MRTLLRVSGSLPEHPNRSPAHAMARKLGVTEARLLAYLEANGGVPDGCEHWHDLTALLAYPSVVTHALPLRAGHAHGPAPRLTRARALYFLPD